MAAVSTRRTPLPRLIGRKPASFAKATSSEVKSPSGPIRISTFSIFLLGSLKISFRVFLWYAPLLISSNFVV